MVALGLGRLHGAGVAPLVQASEAPTAPEDLEAAVEQAAGEHGEGSVLHRRALREFADDLRLRGDAAAEARVREELVAWIESDDSATVRDRVRARGALGIALLNAGDFARAIVELEAADSLEQQDTGTPDPWSGLRVASLAQALEAAGRLDEGLAAAERAVDLCEERLEPSEPRRWISHGQLQSVLLSRGEFIRAAASAMEALEGMVGALSPVHPSVCAQRERAIYLLGFAARSAEAVELAESAVELLKGELAPDDPRILGAIEVCAEAYSRRGDVEAQLHWSQARVEFLAAAAGDGAPETVQMRAKHAHSLMQAGRLNEAEALLEATHELLLARDFGDPELRMSVYSGLARVHEAHARYSRAVEFGLLAHEAAAHAFGERSLLAAVMLQNLALSESWLGRATEARRRFEQALSILEGLGPQQASTTAISRGNFATLLESMGLEQEAFEQYEASLEVLRSMQGESSPWTLTTRGNLGLLLLSSGRFEEARVHLEEVHRVREESLASPHPDLATSHLSLAVLADFEGRLEQARRHYETAREFSAATRGDEHPETLNIAVNLARFERMCGEAAAAVQRLETLHEAMRRQVGADHPYALQARVEHLGALIAMKDWDGAARTASLAVEESDSLARRHRGAMSEGERLSALETHRDLVDTLIAIASRTGDEGHRRRAYDALLTWKGAIARDQVFSREALFGSLGAEGRAVLTELQSVQRELSLRLYAYDAEGGRSVDTLRAERNRLERELVVGMQSAPPPTGAAILETLEPGEALIDFVLHRPLTEVAARGEGEALSEMWGEERVLAFVLRGGDGRTLEVVDLGISRTLGLAVERFLESLRGSRGIELEAEGSDPNADLRALLWDPLASRVADAATVVVSPLGFLARLPFEPLETERGFLLELHRFVYLQDAASLLTLGSGDESDGTAFLGVGAVDFRSAGQPEAAAEAGSAQRASRPRRWAPLPATEGEVLLLSEIHAEAFGGEGATLLMGSEATESQVREAMGKADFVHLATHGFFTPGGPPSLWRRSRDDSGRSRMELGAAEERLLVVHPGLLSGLALAGANARTVHEIDGARDDGYLTAEEVAWLSTSARLVVLSACETGLGRNAAGEGLIGLRRAFRLAGARTVISTLWSVDDKATADLMTRFYESMWLDGETPLDALRLARLEALEANLRNHGEPRPATWGAFVLSGAFR